MCMCIIIFVVLIIYAAVMVDTTTEYVSSLHYEEMINLTNIISSDLNSNSNALASPIKYAVSDEDSSAEGVRVTGKSA